MKYYRTTTHHNSRSSQRQSPLSRDTKQVVRDDENGDELPRHYLPSTYRAFRSKYERHVGAKQLAKLSPQQTTTP